MNRAEVRCLLTEIGVSALLYGRSSDSFRLQEAVIESLRHCLVPACFINRAIGGVVCRLAVTRSDGPTAPTWLADRVASLSGAILALCSAMVLPLIGGIPMRGTGLGPVITLRYSTPASNVGRWYGRCVGSARRSVARAGSAPCSCAHRPADAHDRTR